MRSTIGGKTPKEVRFNQAECEGQRKGGGWIGREAPVLNSVKLLGCGRYKGALARKTRSEPAILPPLPPFLLPAFYLVIFRRSCGAWLPRKHSICGKTVLRKSVRSVASSCGSTWRTNFSVMCLPASCYVASQTRHNLLSPTPPRNTFLLFNWP